MENTSYIALSGQIAQQRKLDVLSNNLANMNTPGFKSANPMFLQYVEKIKDQPFRDINQRRMTMVSDYGTYTNFRQGSFIQTGNQLDMALNGPGFFAIDLGNQQKAYTRDGSFTLDSNRQLVNSAGMPVLDANDNPIVFPAGDHQFRIADDGTVSSETGVLGQIKVVRFDRQQFMDQVGNGLLITEEPELANDGTQIKQGLIEASNVDAITSMTDLIEINRAYQAANNLIQQEDDRMDRAIRKLSGTN